MKSDKQKISSFFKAKGFYIVACCCLAAVGIAAYSAYSGTKANLPVEHGGVSNNATIEQSESGGNNTVDSDNSVTDNQNTSSTDTAEPTDDSATSKPETEKKTKKASAKLSSQFIIPVHGDIIKGYSNKELTFSKTLNDMRLHPAVDIACDKNTEVNAAFSGTVTETANDSFSGNVVVIDHGSGITVGYVGVKPADGIKKGAKVTSETVIGTSAEIPFECEDEPHIHIEVLKNNDFVSPTEIMGIDG